LSQSCFQCFGVIGDEFPVRFDNCYRSYGYTGDFRCIFLWMDLEVAPLKCEYPDCERDEKRDGRCIFHLPDKSTEEAEEFRRELFAYKTKAEEDPAIPAINFIGFVFPRPLFSFENTEFKKATLFDNAIFEGEAPFDGVTFSEDTWFEEARFSGIASFYRATFDGVASFGRAKFSEMALFESAKFSKDAKFGGATFSGMALFGGATFSENAVFGTAIFRESATFWRAIFSGLAIFGGATFRNVSFHEAVFVGFADLGARFEGTAVFERVVFQRDTIESSNFVELMEPQPIPNVRITAFHDASVGKEGEVRFIQPREYDARLGIERNFGIDRVSFLNVDLERFNFQEVEWGILRGRRAVIEEAMMGRPPFETVTPEKVRQVYGRLRANQEKAFRYAEGGDFFIGEMEMRRCWLRGRGWRGLAERFLLWVFSGLSRYGESISRPALATLIVVLGFAGLRPLLNEPSELYPLQPLSLQESLIRSLAAFFQMRSPNLPTDIVERLLSIPILATLFIALRRKLERRS